MSTLIGMIVVGLIVWGIVSYATKEKPVNVPFNPAIVQELYRFIQGCSVLKQHDFNSQVYYMDGHIVFRKENNVSKIECSILANDCARSNVWAPYIDDRYDFFKDGLYGNLDNIVRNIDLNKLQAVLGDGVLVYPDRSYNEDDIRIVRTIFLAPGDNNGREYLASLHQYAAPYYRCKIDSDWGMLSFAP